VYRLEVRADAGPLPGPEGAGRLPHGASQGILESMHSSNEGMLALDLGPVCLGGPLLTIQVT